MIEHDTQQLDTNPAPVKSNTPEEGSELVEESDQRSQYTHIQVLLRNERIRLISIGIGLLAIILSAVIFLFTGSIVAFFVAIVLVPFFFMIFDVYLGKSEAYAR